MSKQKRHSVAFPYQPPRNGLGPRALSWLRAPVDARISTALSDDTREGLSETESDRHFSSEDITPRNSLNCDEQSQESLPETFKSKSQRNLVVEDLPHHVFSRSIKLAIVAMVSSAALLSGLSSNIYFPAQTEISNELNLSENIINLSITTYLVAQGLAPSFWGPMADLFGRRPILIATLIVYVLANVALAFVQNAAMLLFFRAVQAIGSSSTISIGAGMIADITTPSERGGYLGVFSGTRQFSIALGPVFGGILAASLGFRSIFWFLVILSGITTLVIALLLPETLRRIAGNGSVVPEQRRHRPLLASCIGRNAYLASSYRSRTNDLETACQDELHERKQFKWSMFTQPFRMLIEKDVGCALLFGASTYTAWSMMVATTTVLLQANYGFSTLQVGLCFLPNGFGCVAGSVLSGRKLNTTFNLETSLWLHKRALAPDTKLPRPVPTSFPIERTRLSKARLYSAVMIIMFLIFGWSLTPTSPSTTYPTYLAPLLAQFALGYVNTATLNSNSTLVVDLFPNSSASASAIVNLSRNLLAAAGVASVGYLLQALGGPETGAGWLGFVLAGIVVLGLLPSMAHARWGAQWRAEREERAERQREEKLREGGKRE